MSTVLGHVVRADGAGATGRVVLRPVRTPVLAGTDLVAAADVELQPDASGDFTVSLVTGQYAVLIPGARFPVVIGVPDDNETYELASLITSEVPVIGNVAPAITVAKWSSERLREHVLGSALVIADASISGVGATSAVIWPDGSAGTLTITAWNEEWSVATGFTVSHATAGKVVTQPEMTLNGDGQVTNQPDLTVTDL